MMVCKKVELVIFLFAVLKLFVNAEYAVPQVKFEALKKGGFRVSIPDAAGTKRFRFDANINEDVTAANAGKLKGDIATPTNGVFMKEFDEALKVGDTVNYNVFVYNGRLGYRKDSLSWLVAESDLQDTYAPLKSCRTATTTINNGQTTCVGDLIILEEFDGPNVDTSKWTVEHKLPTYEEITAELNTYENRDETRFFKDGILYLKAIPWQEVRGKLDLQNGCTSSNKKQCYYENFGSFLIPPVKSARITSKIPFKYGKVEIKAKLPSGEWLVPVVELESQEKDISGFAPKVFIAYSRGNDHLTGSKGDDIGSRLLYAGPVLGIGERRDQKLITRPATSDQPYSNDYHIYTFEWLPGKMSFYIDSQMYGTIPTKQGFSEFGSTWTDPDAPFNKECFLSLGVAAGGNDDFPDGYISGKHPRPWDYKFTNFVSTFANDINEWSSTWKGDSSALRVEYVKVWAV